MAGSDIFVHPLEGLDTTEGQRRKARRYVQSRAEQLDLDPDELLECLGLEDEHG